jgi:hypothetical protein
MTRYLRLSDNAFGLSTSDMRAALPEISFVEGADLTEWGYAPYEEAAAPTPAWSERVVEIAPVNGVQQWAIETRPLPDLKAAKAAAVNAMREEAFVTGFPIPTGPAAGQHMQLRNADDKANWLIAERGAKKAISLGAGEAPIVPLRSTENITTLVTPNLMLGLLDGLDAWGRAVTKHSWDLKDAIEAAATVAELGAVDITAGWPS